MADQYSHKKFFRRIPSHQLAEYFNAKAVELNVNFSVAIQHEMTDTLNILFTFKNTPLQHVDYCDGLGVK